MGATLEKAKNNKKDDYVICNIKHSLYQVKDEHGNPFLHFYIGPQISCCGTAIISSFEYLMYVTKDQNDAYIDKYSKDIFEAIKNIAEDYNVTNITYFDIPKGRINKFLGKYFTKVHEYRNNNSGNTVEVRVFDFEYTANDDDYEEDDY